VNFLVDGRLRLTINAAERMMRPNDSFDTVVATCKLAGVDPHAYLADFIDKLCRGWPASRLDELLPPNWLAAKQPGAPRTRAAR
jgi:hypothetical protein